MRGGVGRTDKILIFLLCILMNVTEFVYWSAYKCMFVCVCLGEVQLTCKQAPVSSHGMSRDTCNTSEDILQMKKRKCSITTLCMKKAGYSNPHCTLSVATIYLLIWQETDMWLFRRWNQSIMLLGGERECTVECHPLTSAESMSS